MAGQNSQNPFDGGNTQIDIWSLVRNLFAREQYHLQQISRLEQALLNAGIKNHHERTAYNTLQQQYNKLNQTYALLYEQHGTLKDELEALKSELYFGLEERSKYSTRRVEEIA
ncbi:hypothetical protein BJX64DRAFT_283135 [Aspergillus heterothallicus]